MTKVEEDSNLGKKTEMADKSELKAMKEKVEKLEKELAEKDKKLIESESIAHITITKNLEKIRQLEDRNNFLEKELEQLSSQQNAKLQNDGFKQDLSVKEEYMESTTNEQENLLETKVYKMETALSVQVQTFQEMEEARKGKQIQLESMKQHLRSVILKLANADRKYSSNDSNWSWKFSNLAQRLKIAEGCLLTCQHNVFALETRVSKQLEVLKIYNLLMHPLLF